MRIKSFIGQTKKKYSSIKYFPCFYCGVDEAQLKWILITMIGSLVLGSICVLIWAIFLGGFKNVEKIKFDVFEADRRE